MFELIDAPDQSRFARARGPAHHDPLASLDAKIDVAQRVEIVEPLVETDDLYGRPGGIVRIENQVTMYQTDPQGNADDSLLHINVPELYEEYRRLQKLLFAPHARDKFSADGNDIPAGQPIMTPKKARSNWQARSYS
jgi:hypothetical protein